MRLTGSILLVVLLPAFLFPAAAQPIQKPREEDFRIQVNVESVALDVAVTDKQGHPVDTLTKDDFQVFEDGKRQVIRYFEQKDIPVTAGLVLDSSRSMQTKQRDLASAVTAFVAKSHPKDERFLILFNEHVNLIHSNELTQNASGLYDALMRVRPDGMTGLYDAIYAALEECRSGRWEKRVLLVVSDGADNASHRTLKEVLGAAAEQRVLIYTLGLRDPDHYHENPRALKKLSAATGGTAFFPQNGKEIEEACVQIAKEVRNSYEIGYVPSNSSRDGSYRRIRVLARHGKKSLQVRVREGYYAPGGQLRENP